MTMKTLQDSAKNRGIPDAPPPLHFSFTAPQHSYRGFIMRLAAINVNGFL
jgi:hypothetical protein